MSVTHSVHTFGRTLSRRSRDLHTQLHFVCRAIFTFNCTPICDPRNAHIQIIITLDFNSHFQRFHLFCRAYSHYAISLRPTPATTSSISHSSTDYVQMEFGRHHSQKIHSFYALMTLEIFFQQGRKGPPINSEKRPYRPRSHLLDKSGTSDPPK